MASTIYLRSEIFRLRDIRYLNSAHKKSRQKMLRVFTVFSAYFCTKLVLWSHFFGNGNQKSSQSARGAGILLRLKCGISAHQKYTIVGAGRLFT